MIGYDEVLEVDSHHGDEVAPIAIDSFVAARALLHVVSGSSRPTATSRSPSRSATPSTRCRPQILPDTPETRADMASYKASARSLDQAVGAVLNGLHHYGLAERTLIVATTDHGLAFPNMKATLL